jgi:hypothetical protein
MNVIRVEIGMVRKMLEDEAWYEGERRNAFVCTNDFAVVSRVLAILERDGDLLLQHALRLMRM